MRTKEAPTAVRTRKSPAAASSSWKLRSGRRAPSCGRGRPTPAAGARDAHAGRRREGVRPRAPATATPRWRLCDERSEMTRIFTPSSTLVFAFEDERLAKSMPGADDQRSKRGHEEVSHAAKQPPTDQPCCVRSAARPSGGDDRQSWSRWSSGVHCVGIPGWTIRTREALLHEATRHTQRSKLTRWVDSFTRSSGLVALDGHDVAVGRLVVAHDARGVAVVLRGAGEADDDAGGADGEARTSP